MSSPAREYLRELPGNLRQLREDLHDARVTARYLLPFVWRTTMDAEVENAGHEMFEIGRQTERYLAEQSDVGGPR